MTALRVATWNLYLGADLTLVFAVDSPERLQQQARLVHGQLRGTDFRSRARTIARLLVRAQVDVVGLQEVARWTRAPRTGDGAGQHTVVIDFLGELLDALDVAGVSFSAHAMNPNFRGGGAVSAEEEMAVLGHNVVLVRRTPALRVTAEGTGDFTARLDIPTGMPELVLAVQRGYGWVDLAVDGRAVRVVNTHTEAYDPKIRDAQRDELLATLADVPAPVVLVGDLNARPDAVGMPDGYVDAWAVAGGGGPGHTCGQAADLANATSSLRERIDYVFVRGACVRECRLVGDRPEDRTEGGLWPSDHAGVVALLDVPD